MLNTVMIQGRLTADPELRVTPSGVSVVTFTIASERNYVKAGEERKADFIVCSAWRQTAEFIEKYFKKGSMIIVEGSLQSENYTDKDGHKRTGTKVNVNGVSFCGENKNGTQAHTGDNSNKSVSVEYNDFEEIVSDDDDLPW